MQEQQLVEILQSGLTKRWHNRPPLDQDIAQHSWGVAITLLKLHPNPSFNLIKHALYHDTHEKEFGDVPFGTKQKFPKIREMEAKVQEEFFKDNGIDLEPLNEVDALWLSFADQYEAYVFVLTNNYLLDPSEAMRLNQEFSVCLQAKIDRLKTYGFFVEPEGAVN